MWKLETSTDMQRSAFKYGANTDAAVEFTHSLYKALQANTFHRQIYTLMQCVLHAA